MPRLRRRSPSPESEGYVVTTTDSSDTERSETPDPKRSRRSESPADETYREPRVGTLVGLPMRDGDDGETSLCIGLVIEEPTATSSGQALLLETSFDLDADGCTDPRVERRGGYWLTNTHVPLDSATAMAPGITEAMIGEGRISGGYWEMELGPESTRELIELTPQFREYLDAVRKHGLKDAVPESCRARLDAALNRGAPKTDAEQRSLLRLLTRNDPERVLYTDDAVCIACGSMKRCSHQLGAHPLGGDCARVLRAAKPICELVHKLQRQTQLPYPHDFQRMLEDAGALGQ
jgi:hypothetical protein